MTTVLPEEPRFPVPRGCPLHPPPCYSNQRRRGPVSRVTLWNGARAWVVSRYEEVRSVLRDERFSADPTRPGFPEVAPAVPVARGLSLVNLDPPEHRHYRLTLSRGFLPRAMEAQRPAVRADVGRLLDRVCGDGRPSDLVARLAVPLPALTISRVLGLPSGVRLFFERHSALIQATEPDPALLAGVLGELRMAMTALVCDRREQPADDVISRLAVEHWGADRLSRDEVVALATMVLLAGHETTSNTVALSLLALLRHPDQLAWLAEDPSEARVAVAVEELLRYTTAAQFFPRRVAVADVEVGGVRIRAGEGVLVLLGPANRDEDVFPDPDTLDLTRNSRRHLAFGHGVHQCLGHALARVELQEVVGAVARRLPALRLATEVGELDFKDDGFVYGIRALPVTW
ncbi:Cytochrome P450 [Actinoalloteichus cyanogriseus DSM 43889]|uniref:Cytochrome P450 n=1 Tax=Actinoalloteichus caeruleus DSM 43889 TaxID=1120930 RepID=A0ABT1JG26_ACTCY|nr:Cytochrome P450 [Actinoalloteichus caeruleus DSM 43889]